MGIAKVFDKQVNSEDLPNLGQISLYSAPILVILNTFPPFLSEFVKLDCPISDYENLSF